MVIIKLQGGLGNQLFQYAFGTALSIQNRTWLKFDTDDYRKSAFRSYKLKFFNIEGNIASSTEIFWAKILKKLGISNSYLEGYWQGEDYFKEAKETIRKEFTLKNSPGETAKIFIDKIKTVNSVSLHVRRGDYITNEKLKNVLQSLPLDYYKGAVEIIGKKVINPVFFVSSDDIEWAKENLKTDFPTIYVSHKNIEDYEELILMSLCKHNITANSSFSWWGAWLNKNPDKIVIAPKDWFADQSIDTKDLIPETWIKI